MRHIFIAAAGALVASAAIAQTPPASSGSPAQPTTTSPVANANATTAYANEAALSDMYEIESSKLAQSKATSQEVKSFAQTMVRDHTDSTRMVQAGLAKAGISMAPPGQLDPRRQALINQLRGANGTAFDRMYVDQQRQAHHEALVLHSGYAENGESPALRSTAGAIAKVVQQHANMLQSMGPATTSP